MEYIKKYVFEPDYTNMVRAANNQWVDRVPLYEHIIDSKVMYEITGSRPHHLFFSKDMSDSREGSGSTGISGGRWDMIRHPWNSLSAAFS